MMCAQAKERLSDASAVIEGIIQSSLRAPDVFIESEALPALSHCLLRITNALQQHLPSRRSPSPPRLSLSPSSSIVSAMPVSPLPMEALTAHSNINLVQEDVCCLSAALNIFQNIAIAHSASVTMVDAQYASVVPSLAIIARLSLQTDEMICSDWLHLSQFAVVSLAGLLSEPDPSQVHRALLSSNFSAVLARLLHDWHAASISSIDANEFESNVISFIDACLGCVAVVAAASIDLCYALHDAHATDVILRLLSHISNMEACPAAFMESCIAGMLALFSCMQIPFACFCALTLHYPVVMGVFVSLLFVPRH